jgi:excisionase family DNA binding protein
MNLKEDLASAVTDGHRSRLLTIEEIARDLLGCSTRHVRRLADSGRMPRPIRVGSLNRWPRAVIEAWIAEGCPRTGHAGKGGRS